MKKAKQSRSQNSQSELDAFCSQTDSDDSDNSDSDSNCSCSGTDNHDTDNSGSDSDFRPTRNPKQLKKRKHSRKRIRLGKVIKYTSASWKTQCTDLLNTIFWWEDATPFRYPVDLNEYPDYRNFIDYPMDLSTVREKLNNNHYNRLTDFYKDMRLIFNNSRVYNTNRKSKIYSMTIRLSAKFEEHIRCIISDWRAAVQQEEKIKNNQDVRNRRRLVAVQETNINVGASTSGVSPTDIHAVRSESNGENSGHTINEVSNAASNDSPKNSSSISNKTGCNCTPSHLVGHPGSKTLQDFKELFLSQEQCDVTIKVKGEEFQAHKTILIARSPVFASTFRNDMKEKATGIIDIEDCDPSSFSDFLCFLYCGDVENLSSENVFSLFTTADKYDVQDLRSQCMEFIKNNFTVDTFCNTVTLALQHLENELLELTIDFFAKHFQQIILTVQWQSFIVKNPIQANEIMIKALVSNKT